jgi:hypothetical protein
MPRAFTPSYSTAAAFPAYVYAVGADAKAFMRLPLRVIHQAVLTTFRVNFITPEHVTDALELRGHYLSPAVSGRLMRRRICH